MTKRRVKDWMPASRQRADDDLWARPAPMPGPAVSVDPGPIGAPASDPRALAAANDDQQSIGQILQALQNRPVRTSYFVAAIFSAAWVVACIALSWAYLRDLNAALGPNHSSATTLIGLGAAALLPIIFFFGVAHMAWRAQELRLVAQAMAKVAMRLAEPEGVAREFNRYGRAGNPPRGRGDGRRRRTCAGARERA